MRRIVSSLLVLAIVCLLLTLGYHKPRVPVKCITMLNCHGDSCDGSVTQFWVYDKKGRIIVDSINPADTGRSAPHRTEYFHYQGDSVIANDEYPDTLFIKLNEKGFPVMARDKWSDSFHSFFNADGTLKEIRSTRLNGSGELWHTTIDSIIYVNGNIVAYRSGMDNIGDSTTVYCTYYENLPFKQLYNPTDQILSLSNGTSPSQGRFNAQVYSKNLIKTIHCLGVTRSYEYGLDEESRVTQITHVYKYIDGKNDFTSITRRTYFYSGD